jgi:hypothetical protein
MENQDYRNLKGLSLNDIREMRGYPRIAGPKILSDFERELYEKVGIELRTHLAELYRLKEVLESRRKKH